MRFKAFFLHLCLVLLASFILFLIYIFILLNQLELKYKEPIIPKNIDGIITLGGETKYCSPRIDAMINLMKENKNAKWVFTGGSEGFDYSLEKLIVKRKMIENNLNVNKLIAEEKSLNTKENAIFSYNLIKPKNGETWVIITSYYHMPRAVYSFKKGGWNNINFIKYGVGTCENKNIILNSISKLNKAIHEKLGYLYYMVFW